MKTKRIGRPPRTDQPVNVHMRLPGAIYAWLRRQAHLEGRPAGDVITTALESYRARGQSVPDSRMTPSGLLGYSTKFLEAAECAVPGWRSAAIGKRDPFAGTYPLCEYLIGHAIELALKAYLLGCGVPERDLRFRYGHDISRLLKAAKKHGLDKVAALNEDQLGVVRLLSGPYRGKELEYHGAGGPLKRPLERGVLIGTADALVRSQALRRVCHAATTATIGRRRS